MKGTLCILFLAVSATLRVAHLQFTELINGRGSCSIPTSAELGRSDMLSTEGLVAGSFFADDGASRTRVQIIDFTVVCEASGLSRDSVTSISLVVQYSSCSSSPTCDATEAVQRTEQFQYDCRTGDFFSSDVNSVSPVKVIGSPEVRTPEDDTQATLSTPLVSQCGDCSAIQTEGILADPVTHCVECPSECVGLGRCLGVLTGRCCNYYENDLCVINCTSPLVPDDQFDCGCRSLSVPNAELTFSNRFLIGSVVTQRCDAAGGFVTSGSMAMSEVTRTCTMDDWDGQDIVCERFECPPNQLIIDSAGSFTVDPAAEPHFVGTVATFTCNTGYTLMGDATRRCELNTGWSGDNPTCSAVCMSGDLMVDDGTVVINPSPNAAGSAEIDSVGTFTCDEDFVLAGDETRMCTIDGWSGANPLCNGANVGGSSSSCGTPCIVGIVLAVLGVLILAAILAGVAYAVYSYLNHPDTKLAKYDADNINGVAKDNPLYVDPEAVVGDGAEAA